MRFVHADDFFRAMTQARVESLSGQDIPVLPHTRPAHNRRRGPASAHLTGRVEHNHFRHPLIQGTLFALLPWSAKQDCLHELLMSFDVSGGGDASVIVRCPPLLVHVCGLFLLPGEDPGWRENRPSSDSISWLLLLLRNIPLPPFIGTADGSHWCEATPELRSPLS